MSPLMHMLSALRLIHRESTDDKDANAARLQRYLEHIENKEAKE